MTHVILVRHGETVWHDGNRYAGRTDVALTPRGRLQAAELAAWAAGQSIDAVFSSPLWRGPGCAAPPGGARAAAPPRGPGCRGRPSGGSGVPGLEAAM
ncbi:histidine phosphatase family protein, partial [Streptomyces lasiicapitis]|uniref:histidine phosphatase family protein n=1 Tax=Streptomyces lasiicapitis TaxID=1923961 RepID=UPI00367A7562